MPLRNPLELFDRNSGAKFLMSAPKPKQREVRSGSKGEILAKSRCFPLHLRQRTCGGCTAMTVSCQFRKSFDLFPRGITAVPPKLPVAQVPLRKSCRSVVDAKPRGKMLEPIL
jgi:hypothetical protein